MSWSEEYGWMTRANGSFDFLRREWVVGTAFRVDRTYLGGQFASSEGVQLDYYGISHRQTSSRTGYELTFAGRMIGGGGSSSSETLKGWLRRSVG